MGVAYGGCHAVLFPVLISILMNHSPASFRGRMSVLFQLFVNAGMSLAANLGGLLIGLSLPFALYFSAAFTLSGILLLLTGPVRRTVRGPR
jgi:MFS family permease